MSNPQFHSDFLAYHNAQRIDYRAEKLFIALFVPIGAFIIFTVVICSAYLAQPNTTYRAVGKAKLDTEDTRNPVLNAFATADAAISTTNGATK